MTVVAVIGCGRISDMAHFPALSQMENVRIKYACDLLIEKAEEKKEKYPKIENVITDYNVALADEEVDAVFVLTPNYAHYTIAMDALKAGKHVLCEKPITVNYTLSLEMAQEAEKQGKILDIGVCNRYQNTAARLRFRRKRAAKPRNISKITERTVHVINVAKFPCISPFSKHLHRLLITVANAYIQNFALLFSLLRHF